MSAVAYAYDIIIGLDVVDPGHGKVVVDGLKAIDKNCLRELILNIGLPKDDIDKLVVTVHDGTKSRAVSFLEAFQMVFFASILI